MKHWLYRDFNFWFLSLRDLTNIPDWFWKTTFYWSPLKNKTGFRPQKMDGSKKHHHIMQKTIIFARQWFRTLVVWSQGTTHLETTNPWKVRDPLVGVGFSGATGRVQQKRCSLRKERNLFFPTHYLSLWRPTANTILEIVYQPCIHHISIMYPSFINHLSIIIIIIIIIITIIYNFIPK